MCCLMEIAVIKCNYQSKENVFTDGNIIFIMDGHFPLYILFLHCKTLYILCYFMSAMSGDGIGALVLAAAMDR